MGPFIAALIFTITCVYIVDANYPDNPALQGDLHHSSFCPLPFIKIPPYLSCVEIGCTVGKLCHSEGLEGSTCCSHLVNGKNISCCLKPTSVNHQLNPRLQLADAQRDDMNARIEEDKERLKLMNSRKQYYDKKKKMNEYLLNQRIFNEGYNQYRKPLPWYNPEQYGGWHPMYNRPFFPAGGLFNPSAAMMNPNAPLLNPSAPGLDYVDPAYRKPIFKRHVFADDEDEDHPHHIIHSIDHPMQHPHDQHRRAAIDVSTEKEAKIGTEADAPKAVLEIPAEEPEPEGEKPKTKRNPRDIFQEAFHDIDQPHDHHGPHHVHYRNDDYYF